MLPEHPTKGASAPKPDHHNQATTPPEGAVRAVAELLERAAADTVAELLERAAAEASAGAELERAALQASAKLATDLARGLRAGEVMTRTGREREVLTGWRRFGIGGALAALVRYVEDRDPVGPGVVRVVPLLQPLNRPMVADDDRPATILRLRPPARKGGAR